MRIKDIISLICIIMVVAFTNVMAAGMVDITLAWYSPMKNVDSSPVEDLAGFYLYQRADTNFVHQQNIITSIFENVPPIPNPTYTNEEGEIYGDEFMVDLQLTTSSWFAVTAVDFAGNESDFNPPLFVDVTEPEHPLNFHFNRKP